MMISLPSSLGHLTLSEIEQQFAGGKADAKSDNVHTRRHNFVINTKLAEVTLSVRGCEGANFFEHVVSGVTLLSE